MVGGHASQVYKGVINRFYLWLPFFAHGVFEVRTPLFMNPVPGPLVGCEGCGSRTPLLPQSTRTLWLHGSTSMDSLMRLGPPKMQRFPVGFQSKHPERVPSADLEAGVQVGFVSKESDPGLCSVVPREKMSHNGYHGYH